MLARKLFYWIVAPLLLISWLLEPFTNDVRIYLGAAKVTLLTPGFPMTLDSVWESRFVGHRFLYYCLEGLTPFEGLAAQVWLKLLAAIVMLAVLYYFSKRVSTKWSVPFDYVFIISFLGMFAVNNFMIFAAEAHSVIIGMLMVAMLLDDRPLINGLAGLLVLPLVILKGLPVLLVPIAVLVVVMLCPDTYKNRLMAAACSIPIVIAAWVAMALYFPHFITDIFLNTKMAHIGMLSYWDVGTYFVKYGLGVIGFLPLIVVGLFVTFLLLSVVRREHLRDVGLLLLMWVVAAMYALVIQEFFYYHFYLGVIPAILTCLYFLKLYEHHRAAMVILVVAILIIYCGVVSSWSVGLAGKGYVNIQEREDTADLILAEYPDLLDQPSTLYLDDGLAAYYFPTQSACRYVGALPYQRHTAIWNMSDKQEYWDMRNCAMAYTGKYILVDESFIPTTIPVRSELRYKLDTEYNMTAVHYWSVYSRS